MSVPVFHIDTTQNQLQQALLAQRNNIQFASGVLSAIAADAAESLAVGGINAAKYIPGAKLQQKFGIDGKPYVLPDSITGQGLYSGERSSFNGQAVFSNLEIKGGSYTRPNGHIRSNGQGDTNTIDYPSTRIDTVLFNVSQDKLIVKTAIQGLNGTIKEYISMGDFKVEIVGVIPSTNGVYPLTAVTQLIQILKAPVAFSVSSKWLSTFGITNLVVDDFSFPQTEGSYSYQAFKISCSSDFAIPITINQQNN